MVFLEFCVGGASQRTKNLTMPESLFKIKFLITQQNVPAVSVFWYVYLMKTFGLYRAAEMCRGFNLEENLMHLGSQQRKTSASTGAREPEIYP